MASPKFLDLQQKLVAGGDLFEDPDFPADESVLMIYPDVQTSYITWKRPGDMTSSPKFVVDGATCTDVHQGGDGDCFFLSSVACVASSKEGKLIDRVVPKDQSFTNNYCGMFRFNFWRLGEWVEVIIDDRLPMYGAALFYGGNKTNPDEFWLALLEKAYAKFIGDYKKINGGASTDALTELTGGLVEDIVLDKISLPDLKHLMINTRNMNSLSTAGTFHDDRGNGLAKGHAYSVLGVKEVKVDSEKQLLVHIRNPWGHDGEWKGPWSDKSDEWQKVSEADRKSMLRNKNDGEFWIHIEDFMDSYRHLSMCHLTPDAISSEIADDLQRSKWQTQEHRGSWVKGQSAAGGRDPYSAKFWTNPQFNLSLVKQTKKTHVVISLTRPEREKENRISIGFYVFKLLESNMPQHVSSLYDTAGQKITKAFDGRMQNTDRIELEPANYVIIPCTYRPDQESEFYLRVICEQDFEIKPADKPISMNMGVNLHSAPPRILDWEQQQAMAEFEHQAEATGTVGAEGLVQVFKAAFQSSDGWISKGLNLETCRGLISMVLKPDAKVGPITKDQFTRVWKNLKHWRENFQVGDMNDSNTIEVDELRTILSDSGFGDSMPVAAIMEWYGGANGYLTEEDFIQAVCKMYQLFRQHQKLAKTGKISVGLEEWMIIGLTA